MGSGTTPAGRCGGASSSLAVLIAVLIIITASVAFLVLSLYSTSIMFENVDVDRMVQKSREVIKLVIMKEAVEEGGSVRYPVKMQLKNAWSGTSEITYIVVLDREGGVLYERGLDPPLTLYATETRFMKPSELMPELSQYDEDWYRMRQEVGLLILHTRLGNRFTSIYEGSPVGSGDGGGEDITITYITSTPTTTTTPVVTRTTSITATQTVTETTSITATLTSTTTITWGSSITWTTTTPVTTTTTTKSLTRCIEETLVTGYDIAGTVTITARTIVVTLTSYTSTTFSCTFTTGADTVYGTITVPTTTYTRIDRTTCRCAACPAATYGAAVYTYTEPNSLFYAPYVGGFLITLLLSSMHEELLKRRGLTLSLIILMMVGVAMGFSKTSSVTITVTVTESPVTVTAPTTTITQTYTSTTTLTTTTSTTPTTITTTRTQTTPSTTVTVTATAPTLTTTTTLSSIAATEYRCMLTKGTVTLTLWTVAVSTYTLYTKCTFPGLYTVYATTVRLSTETMWYYLGTYSVQCS